MAAAVVGVGATIDLLDVRRDLLAAEALIDSVGPATLGEADGLVLASRRASRIVGGASARIDDSTWLRVLRPLPLVGDQIRAVDDIADASVRAARSAERHAPELSRLLAEAGQAGTARVAVLERAADVMAAVAAEVGEVSVSRPALAFWPLRKAADTLERRLTEVASSVGTAAGVADVLADVVAGPTTALVLAANNAEMRASAMALQVGQLTIEDGRFRSGRFRAAEDLVLDDPVPEGAPLADLYRFGQPDRDLRGVGIEPDFTIAAPLAAALGRAARFDRPDLVIHTDLRGLSALLRLVGGVDFGGRHLSPERMIPFLLIGQYQAADTPSARRERLGDLAEVIVAALSTERWDVGAAAEDLARAVEGRNLMVWARQPARQRALAEIGVDGGLPAEGLLIAVQNVGGNKLDPYLATHLQLRSVDRGQIEATVTLTNDAPDGLPDYVALGPVPGLGAGTYRGVVTLHLPNAAVDVEVVDREASLAGVIGNHDVVGVPFQIAAGVTESVTVRFSLPPGMSVRIMPSGRLPTPVLRIDGSNHRTAGPVTWER